MRIATFAASILLVVCAQATANEQYRLQTAADLALVCSTPASDRNHVAAVAFCHGVLAGAWGYFSSTTPAADRFVCPPATTTTRAQVASGFVAWIKARPQYNNDGAIDALFRFAAEAYPCKR